MPCSPEDDQPSAFIDSKEEAEVTDYAVVLPSGDPYARYVDLSEWGLVGSINNWGNPDAEGTVTPDIEMWTNGSLHVAKGVNLSKGDEIKFRKNSSWDLNLGYGEDVTAYELGEEFDLAEGGANIVVAEDGVYDLILNNYGPDNYIASAHIEVDDNMTAAEIDALSRVIQAQVYAENAVILGALGIYAVNTGNDEISRLRSDIRHMVMSHEGALQMHGFFLDEKTSALSFDVIIDFAVDRQAVYNDIVKEVREKYPQYNISVALDTDFSD